MVWFGLECRQVGHYDNVKLITKIFELRRNE